MPRAQVEARIARACAMQPQGEHVLRLVNEGSVASGVAALLRALRYGHTEPMVEGPAAEDGRGALGLLGGGRGWHLCRLSAIGASTFALPSQRLADPPTGPKYDGSIEALAAEHAEPLASQLANHAKVRSRMLAHTLQAASAAWPIACCPSTIYPSDGALYPRTDVTPSEGRVQTASPPWPMVVVCRCSPRALLVGLRPVRERVCSHAAAMQPLPGRPVGSRAAKDRECGGNAPALPSTGCHCARRGWHGRGWRDASVSMEQRQQAQHRIPGPPAHVEPGDATPLLTAQVMGFVYGVARASRGPLTLSLRYEDASTLVYDDPLARSTCHLNAVRGARDVRGVALFFPQVVHMPSVYIPPTLPLLMCPFPEFEDGACMPLTLLLARPPYPQVPSDVHLSDWRALLRRPTQGRALLRRLLSAARAALATSFWADEGWRRSVLRPGVVDSVDDLRLHEIAALNAVPSQAQPAAGRPATRSPPHAPETGTTATVVGAWSASPSKHRAQWAGLRG